MNEQYIKQLENYTKVTNDYNLLKVNFMKMESKHLAEHAAKESMSKTLAEQSEKVEQYNDEIGRLKTELLKLEESLNTQRTALEIE